MAALSREEIQHERRRKRLIKGLLVGGAAIGLPALANTLVSRKARRLPASRWGSGDHYAWKQGEIAFQRLGEGRPLVLLHSFGPGHSSAEWRHAAELLAAEFEIFAPDLIGWGRSDMPSLHYGGELYIRLLADFLDDVVGEPALIVAAGLPSAYAVQLGVDRPELLRALALVVPLGIGLHGDEPELKDAIVHRLLRLPILGTSALNLFTSRSGISHYLRREVFASPEAVDESLVDQHYQSSHQPSSHTALAAYLSGYLNHNVRDIVGRLELPMWIAWGRRASSPRVEIADLWLRQLPAAELEVFEHCGILPHAESPEEFSRKLELFLVGLDD